MGAANRPAADTREDALEPIDLDRLAVDLDYRRAVMLSLKRRSGPAPAAAPAGNGATPKD